MNIEELKESYNLLNSIKCFSECNEIDNNERNRILSSLIALKGEEECKIIAMEELSELIQSISKTMRKDKNLTTEAQTTNRLSLLEELIDVKNFITIIEKIFNITEKELEIMSFIKLDRMSERIEEIKNEK